jgi:hypothetical protein
MAKLNADLLDDLTIKAAKPTEKNIPLRNGNGLFLLIHRQWRQILSPSHDIAQQG